MHHANYYEPPNSQHSVKRGPDSLEETGPGTVEKKQKNTETSSSAVNAGVPHPMLFPSSSSHLLQKPSRVLHVRNLPLDCTEAELNASASPFGKVQNVLVLKGKNQAFIEMETAENATSLISYYDSIQASIRGKPIYFQYSNRESLNDVPVDNPSRILLVTVLNLVYPVTIDVLHQVFSKFGVVQKIVIFQKNAGFQSLIQYGKVEDAEAAKKALDGQNIYSGCCTLRVQFSSNTNELTVKFNNDRTRDFVNSVPNAPPPALLDPAVTSSLFNWQGQFHPSMGMGGVNPMGMQVGMPMGMGGMQVGMGNLNGGGHMPGHLGMTDHLNNGPNASMLGMNKSHQVQTVAFIRHLDPARITPDVLFTLFGVYGDVTRVKILYSHPDQALIQFTSPQGCALAVQHLNNIPLQGQRLAVTFSTNNYISGPKRSGVEDSDRFTKDYTGSQFHRYRIEGSKNYANIVPPSPILHVSNIDPSISEEMLKQTFARFGHVVAVKMLPRDKKMAIVQMGDVAQSVDALISLHNVKLDGTTTYLRVSFSRHFKA
eukprot:TRINITY_DN1081_c0_g1_i1.p1 TRINITY_DN1081_c0_g1~~TRINITY_DN1081_c0_g1_i1.p1  ORF type:complete len:542 (+),score=117.86 TRINITY_DN1081_c0_g1_i1:243-1868(+)